MSSLELTLRGETEEAIPFSVRLARKRAERLSPPAASKADRRAHPRLAARDLSWLRTARLAGGGGISLVDLSAGGALLETEVPLKPGSVLTLELSGSSFEAAVPFQVLRCHVARLRGEATTYRGACAFRHVLELPEGMVALPVNLPIESEASGPSAADFVGTDGALNYLFAQCTTAAAGAAGPDGPRVTLERTGILHVLDSLHARASSGGVDPFSRHTAALLGAILPALHGGASQQTVLDALEERLRRLPGAWQSRLHATRERLVTLIEHCSARPVNSPPSLALSAAAVAAPPGVPELTFTESTSTNPPDSTPQSWMDEALQADSAFQKIVVRYTDGKIMKGYTQDFHSTKPQFSLWPSINATPSEQAVIRLAALKAVFFVRDFNGNAGYNERKIFGERGAGRRIEVTFADGEVVLGTTLNYRPDGQGFFVNPVDPAANNTRIFVVSATVRRVRFP
jgi:hypothetical protein